MKLETERLIIRPLTLGDKNEIFEYRRDKETNKYQGWIPETIEDTEAFLGKCSEQINIPHTWFQFAIVFKETQQTIGDLGIHFIDKENKQVEIGFTLSRQTEKPMDFF